jgi:nucleoside 2-deoxyribosyltransferase
MTKIYIASPFFDEAGIERGYVEQVEKILRGKGLPFFSPMRSDQNNTGKEAKEIGSRDWSLHTFTQDIKMLQWCDVVVGLYHGNYSDSGTSFELGFAYAINKPVVLVHLGEDSNLMCHEGAFANITLEELTKYDFNDMKPSFYHGKMF